MRRILLPIMIITLMLLVPPSALDVTSILPEKTSNLPLAPYNFLESASAQGDNGVAITFISREIAGQSISVMNSYANTAHHNGTLDFTQYLISGWTLYNTTIDIENITAAPEQEVVGVQDETPNFRIYEIGGLTNITQLAQGFYNQPHNASLLNYSVYHSTPTYDTATNGYAYFTVRSDHTSSSSNLTTPVPLVYVGGTKTWTTLTTSTNLTENTVYYALIDGNALQKSGLNFPDIQWHSEDSAGTFASYRYLRDNFDSWGSQAFEALLNYTYIPWNQTSNASLDFQTSEIEMRGNATSLTGNSWSWTSPNNITLLRFDSNQSVYINHNLTLWYKRNVSSQTVWDIPDSGGTVLWNQTMTVAYPKITETSNKFANMTRMTDWTATGLFNGTSTSDYDNYTSISTIVTCSNMTNGTWTMTFTAHNYLTDVNSLSSVSILDDISITALIKDGSSINATDGSTNLTIWQDSTRVSNPNNVDVTNGATQYLWDINTDTSNNGTYRIEVYWVNGTEAGYLTKQVVVYYPTTLEAKSYLINAYTQDSFAISVDYDDTFTPQYLDGSSSTVVYSFDGAANITMTDHSNGTWTASVSTVGKNFGTYDVDVFAEGFAIENQTLTITVNLLHDTLPLVGTWSQPNEDNITFTQSTNLTILYQRVDGTNVTDAIVNVTIDGSIYDLHYDPITETYWIQFNGSDFTGFDTFSLTIEAWKTGYVPRTNSTLSLIVREEPTTLTLTWTFTTIDYLGQIDLTVAYWYGGTSVPAFSPNVNMTINGGSPILLNQSGDYWTANFTGQYLDLGSHNIVVYAWAYGYTSQTDIETLTVNNVATNALVILWEPANVTLPYTSILNLTVDYTYSGGDIDSAIVNVTIDGVTYLLTYSGVEYYVSISGESIDFGVYNATISAWSYGYFQQTNITVGVNITLASNSFIVEWDPIGLDITYVEAVRINVIYTADFIPISEASVQLFVNGTTIYDLTYNATTEKWEIILFGNVIDLGLWNFTIRANKTGYDTGIETQYVTVNLDPCDATPNWTNGNVSYTHQIDLDITLLDSLGQPIVDAVVNATYQGTNYTMAYLGSGVYRLVFNGTDGLGMYPITVNTFRYGYINVTTPLSLQIDPTDTNDPLWTYLIEGYSSSVLYYDGWASFSYYIEDIDAIPLSLAIVNLNISGNVFAMDSHDNGTFTLDLIASDYLIGTHEIEITPVLYGYNLTSVQLSLEIVAVPTHLVISEVPSIMFINDTVQLYVQYINNHTGQLIEPETISMTWSGESPLYTQISPGHYNITLNTTGLEIAIHELNIQFEHTNYLARAQISYVFVRAVFTFFAQQSLYEQYENETIVLRAIYLDTDHEVPILGASVNVTIDGELYTMIHTGEGEYEIAIFLADMLPGDYTLNFTAFAYGCSFNSSVTTLIIIPKTLYTVAIDIGTAIQGATLGVTVTVSHSDTDIDVGGLSITIFVSMIDENGDSILHDGSGVTSSLGVTQVNFDIPLGIQEIVVWAYFEGSISEWPITTDEQTLAVNPPTGLFETMIQFLTTPFGIFLLFAIFGIIAARLYYVRKVRPRKHAGVANLEKQLKSFNDLKTLQHFMAIYLDRGTCVFYHPFREARIQPDLISGFIAAITSVYGEIKGDGVRGTLEEIHYQGLRLNSYSGKYLIGVLIIEGDMTPLLKERMEFMIEMFEQQYETDLHEWMGVTDCFDPEWIVSNLNSTFTYHWILPHSISDVAHAKGTEKKILKIIQSDIGEEKEFLLEDFILKCAKALKKSEAEILDIFLTMEDNGIIEPIGTQTVLQRQGMGIADSDEDEEEEIDYVESTEISEEAKDVIDESETKEEIAAVEEIVEEETEPEIDSADKFVDDIESLLSEKPEKNDNEQD